jgi:hypothetical protein
MHADMEWALREGKNHLSDFSWKIPDSEFCFHLHKIFFYAATNGNLKGSFQALLSNEKIICVSEIKIPEIAEIFIEFSYTGVLVKNNFLHLKNSEKKILKEKMSEISSVAFDLGLTTFVAAISKYGEGKINNSGNL